MSKTRGLNSTFTTMTKNMLAILVITKAKLIWCKGETKPENGIPITWQKFAEFMEGQQKA